MARVRIGTVGYLNAAPLTDALDPARFEVIADHPRGIAQALKDGLVDVALAPVAAVLSDDDYRIVPGVCIGANGAVQSVVIVAETEPEAWTELVLDGSSRTSVTLARLIVGEGPLASRVSDALVITDGAPGDGPARVGGTVAAVVIGDPARTLPGHLTRWDLAELWKDWTGKPFVFAVWAAREGLDPAVRDALKAAGLAGVAGIADRYDGADRDYLLHHIRYDFDDDALVGLRRYAAMAHRAGLIAREHITLFPPTSLRRARRQDLDAVLLRAVEGERLSVADARALHEGLHTTELGVAAHARRADLHGGTSATYLVERRIGAEVVQAGGAAFADAVGEAAEADVTVVRLLGLGRLPIEACLQRLGVVRAAGLQAVGITLAEVGAHHAAGLVPAEVLASLVAAGLSCVCWRVGRVMPDRAVLQAAVDAGIPVKPDLIVGPDGDLDDVYARFDVLRRASDVSPAITSVAVHLSLPAGALVEPGRATTAAWMRTVAMARLFLPHVRHVVASPQTQGLDACQAALFMGADDLGAVGEGPEVPLGVGEGFVHDVETAERVLRVAGLEAVRRDVHFAPVGGPLTAMRRVRPVAQRARRPDVPGA